MFTDPLLALQSVKDPIYTTIISQPMKLTRQQFTEVTEKLDVYGEPVYLHNVLEFDLEKRDIVFLRAKNEDYRTAPVKFRCELSAMEERRFAPHLYSLPMLLIDIWGDCAKKDQYLNYETGLSNDLASIADLIEWKGDTAKNSVYAELFQFIYSFIINTPPLQ